MKDDCSHRSGKKMRIEAIQYPPVPWKEFPRILDPRLSLEPALHQVSQGAENRHHQGQSNPNPRARNLRSLGHGEYPQQNSGNQSSGPSFPSFAGDKAGAMGVLPHRRPTR